MYDFEAQIARIKEAQKEHEDNVYRDLGIWERSQRSIATHLKVATFDTWRALGVSVRRGEQAHKVNGVCVFHRTQTTAVGE